MIYRYLYCRKSLSLPSGQIITHTGHLSKHAETERAEKRHKKARQRKHAVSCQLRSKMVYLCFKIMLLTPVCLSTTRMSVYGWDLCRILSFSVLFLWQYSMFKPMSVKKSTENHPISMNEPWALVKNESYPHLSVGLFLVPFHSICTIERHWEET